MIKGFKDFILRGNVIDLAVAVVIGAAFATIVTAFTDKIVNPIIASLGGANANGLGFSIRGGKLATKTFVDIGAVITAAINFVIVAAVIYLVLVVPMNKLAERRKRGEAPVESVPTEDIVLLKEIRDLLAARSTQA
jgi:large conductance mechanosensitive channel